MIIAVSCAKKSFLQSTRPYTTSNFTYFLTIYYQTNSRLHYFKRNLPENTRKLYKYTSFFIQILITTYYIFFLTAFP